MAEVKDLNIVDASNTARQPENQNPSTVNDGIRALEGMLARQDKDCVEGNINSTGSANAYLVAANRTIAAYYDGMRQCFHANFANTGAATLNIDSVGAKTIKKNHDQDLASGDIEEHQFVEVVYSASDDTFQMLSPVANVTSAASESAAGIVELATQSEVNTGSDTARAITPAGLTGWTPAVGTVTVVSTDKLLLADASASGVLKQGLVSDIVSISQTLVPLSRVTTSSAASYTWATGSWFSTYRTLKLIGWLQPATDDVELWLRMSDDGGSTYEADASDYRYNFVGQETGAGANRAKSSTGDSKIALGASDGTYSVGNASTERIEFEFTFNNLNSSAFFKLVNVVFNYSAAVGDMVRMTGGGRMDATAAVNGLQLLFESGDIATGDVTLYGVANS